jgi:hypothetical protein
MRSSHENATGGRTPSRAASALAWSLLALTLVAMIVGHALERATDSLAGSLVEELGLTAAFVAFPVVGALIASRHPRNAVGWLLLGIGLLVAVLVLSTSYARYGLVLHPDRQLPGATLAAWVENWAWLPLVGTICTVLLLLFPTGRPPSRRWRPVAWVAGGYISLIMMLSMLEERLINEHFPGDPDGYNLANPIGIRGLGDVEDMVLVLVPSLPLILLCASSLIFRYRNAPSAERQQLKWVAVAAMLLAAGMTVGDWAQLPDILFPLTLAALPASIGVAMLKYRLYDIDVIINRTLVYGALTAILGLFYFVLVVLLQQLTEPITPESDLAIAGSTLAVAALFRPARSRVQSFIDRRFYRRKYDAAKTLDEFTQRLRDEIDLASLTEELLDAVDRTIQPRHGSVWLRAPSASGVHSGASAMRQGTPLFAMRWGTPLIELNKSAHAARLPGLNT